MKLEVVFISTLFEVVLNQRRRGLILYDLGLYTAGCRDQRYYTDWVAEAERTWISLEPGRPINADNGDAVFIAAGKGKWFSMRADVWHLLRILNIVIVNVKCA